MISDCRIFSLDALTKLATFHIGATNHRNLIPYQPRHLLLRKRLSDITSIPFCTVPSETDQLEAKC